MDIDKAVASALELAKPFWSESGAFGRAFINYYKALGKALVAMDTEFTGDPQPNQDQKEWLIELHTLMVFAYSRHNGAVAVTHYKAFDQIIYNYWYKMEHKGGLVFRGLACQATNKNPGIELITRDQPYRHDLIDTAFTVTTQFYGSSAPEIDKAREFWEGLQ